MGRAIMGRDGVFRTHARNAAHVTGIGGMVMAEDKWDISEALSYYLHKRDMTVKRCAELCGFHRARLTGWKYGRNAATMEHIKTLCNVLDVPVEIFENMCVEHQYTAHNLQKRDRRYNNDRGCAGR